MFRRMALLLFCVFMVSAVGFADDNLCHSSKAGHCYDDIEWQIGYFWARNEPSVASCANYHYTFGAVIGDIWGFCNEYGMPDPDSPTNARPPDNGDNGANGANGADADYVFKLTSQSHPMPDGDADPCPVAGLDPIINYEDNTFVCGTSF